MKLTLRSPRAKLPLSLTGRQSRSPGQTATRRHCETHARSRFAPEPARRQRCAAAHRQPQRAVNAASSDMGRTSRC
eukprot:4152585-Prymnesium_polylepis.1